LKKNNPKYAYSYIWKRKRFQQSGQVAKQNKIPVYSPWANLELVKKLYRQVKVKRKIKTIYMLRICLSRLTTHVNYIIRT